MKKLELNEILSNEEYLKHRDSIRNDTLAIKGRRRIHVGEHLTFLFETTDTMRYQVQEMLRVEGRSSAEDIAHEVATYNELLGDQGELGCTLLIEIDDQLQRDIVLRKWIDLPQHLYVKDAEGNKDRATFDERQVGDTRLSSVQYLKFKCGLVTPGSVGLDKPGLELETELNSEQASALKADLEAA